MEKLIDTQIHMYIYLFVSPLKSREQIMKKLKFMV